MNVKTEQLECTVSVKDFMKSCMDPAKFLKFCEACQNYSNNWSCPPLPENAGNCFKDYASLHLVLRRIFTDTFSGEEEALSFYQDEKKRFSEALLQEERKIPGTRSVFPGNCPFCASCSREKGEPCRKPDAMRYSLEALGADLTKATVLYFGFPVLFSAQNQLPPYYVLIGGLFSRN